MCGLEEIRLTRLRYLRQYVSKLYIRVTETNENRVSNASILESIFDSISPQTPHLPFARYFFPWPSTTKKMKISSTSIQYSSSPPSSFPTMSTRRPQRNLPTRTPTQDKDHSTQARPQVSSSTQTGERKKPEAVEEEKARRNSSTPPTWSTYTRAESVARDSTETRSSSTSSSTKTKDRADDDTRTPCLPGAFQKNSTNIQEKFH